MKLTVRVCACCGRDNDDDLQVLREIGASWSEIASYAWNPSNRYWEIPFEKRDW
jgi:hypothetical protein